MNSAFPEEGYDKILMQLWEYIDRYIIDHRHGGWRKRGRDSVHYQRNAAKSSLWKDPCHEGNALLSFLERCDQGPA